MSLLLFASASSSAQAVTLDFGNLTLVSSFETDSLYNLSGLVTWNGNPVSPTNRPSNFQRKLFSEVDLYVRTSEKNKLYVVIDNTITTQNAQWFGQPFINITQTGVIFNLPLIGGGFITDVPTLTPNFAAPDQKRFENNTDTAIDTTPGYEVSLSGQDFTVKTTDANADFGIVSNNFTTITGAVRLKDSAVFELIFPNSVELLYTVDYSAIQLSARYGDGSQFNDASQTFAHDDSSGGGGASGTTVPEPSTFFLLGLGLLKLAFFRKS